MTRARADMLRTCLAGVCLVLALFTACGDEAGGYSLFVANDGPHDEQIGYEVLLTPSASGSGR